MIVDAISSVGYSGPVAVEVVTPPTALAVSLDDVTERLRLPFDDEDVDIQTMLLAAIDHVEHLTGRKLAPQTVRYWYDGVPCRLTIWMPEPFRAISSVTTYDEDDVSSVLSASLYRTDTRRARIVVKETATSWPPTELREVNAMAIEATVGYATVADIPQPLKEAVMLAVLVSYQRDAVTTAERAGYEMAIAAKTNPYRWRMGVA